MIGFGLAGEPGAFNVPLAFPARLQPGRANEQAARMRAELLDRIEAILAGAYEGPKSPAEWAAIFDCSVRTFKRWRDEGKLRWKQVGPRLLFIHRDDVRAKTRK